MRSRRFAVLIASVAGLGLPALQALPAVAVPPPPVQVNSDSADLDWFQYADDNHQTDGDTDGENFLTYGAHRGPKKESATEGTAAATVSQASSIETTAQPPFPLSPVSDIAMDGTSASHATATGNGPAVPVADSDGSFNVDIITNDPVPVFFSGFIQTVNSDPHDSCATVTVDLTGGAIATERHFAVSTGDCPSKQPHSKGWADSITLTGGAEYELDVDYSSEVDDVVPGEPKSVSETATASINLSLFPPTAQFTKTLSGSRATFDASKSAAGQAGRTLKKWNWTFGDGKTATTTKPTVTHSYPAVPKRVRTYTVTLQVVDDGGGVSSPVTLAIDGTRTTLHLKKAGARLSVSGAVSPERSGKHVIVTLKRKTGHHFTKVRSTRLRLDHHSAFTGSLPRAGPGRCLVTAHYPGDKTHLASQHTTHIAC